MFHRLALDFFGGIPGEVHDEPPTLPVHRDGLAPYLAHEKGRRSRQLPRGQTDLVLRHRLLDRTSHVALRAEKPIGRHHVVDPLVGAEVVVVVDKVLEALPRFVEIERAHPLPKLVANRLPQPLALSYGLRMMTPSHDVLDSVFAEELFELGSSPPGKILLPLVGKYLFRPAKTLDAVEKGFHDKLARLL